MVEAFESIRRQTAIRNQEEGSCGCFSKDYVFGSPSLWGGRAELTPRDWVFSTFFDLSLCIRDRRNRKEKMVLNGCVSVVTAPPYTS